MSRQFPSSPERRSFLSYLNGGVTSLLAMAAGSAAIAQETPAAVKRWEPARHASDDWLEMPVKHRLVFDTTSQLGLGDAIAFASNFIRVNKSDYGLQNGDLAVLIVVRHNSTAFGYNDAIWAKYGVVIAGRSKAEDPKTKEAPKVNIYNAAGYGELVPTHGATLDALAKQGVRLGVCSSATHALASGIAKSVGGDTTADAIYTELTANLVANSRMVPAGIVAVNRAQERGYSVVRT